MENNDYKYERLEQYDYVDTEHIERIENMYGLRIGLFLIRFSFLEHNLNLVIAEVINDHAHDMGYQIIENLSFNNRIELFYKLYLQLTSFTDKKYLPLLRSIKGNLNSLNAFRNTLAHANWSTITKEGYVRIKIITDSDDGFIKFKTVKITIKQIRQNINQLTSVERDMDKFIERIEKILYAPIKPMKSS